MSSSTGPSRQHDQAGRVVAAHGRDAVVENEDRERIRCRLAGRRHAVVCGDRVRWTAGETEGGGGTITAVLPRTTELARLNLRGAAEPVAANLSQLVAVLAPRPAADFGLCDRYLAAAEWAGLRACVVVNKFDLPDAPALLAAATATYRAAGYPVVRASRDGEGGVSELAARLAGETSVLVGQSGVGKSSLTNRLVPGVEAVVREISEAASAGRHTTTASTLYHLPGGGELIDSPGVRDFAPPLPAPREIEHGFREIAAAASCRFADCRHLHEPGCAVAAAAADGRIDARRLASYRELLGLAEQLARPGSPRFRR
ncbi:MAG: ribosome small subunit-dependent GTPase A [Gammaproteobacteria bacterium]|nr:MAG: ribosome small subunit-dependent GTPase A [Gammaproteobacteria bacterium]